MGEIVNPNKGHSVKALHNKYRSQAEQLLQQVSVERMCICTPCLHKTAEECVVLDEELELIMMYYNTSDNSTHLKILHGEL